MKKLLLLAMAAALPALAGAALAGGFASPEALENYGELSKPKYGALTYLDKTVAAPLHWRARVEMPKIDGKPPDRNQVLAAAAEVFHAMESETGPVNACVIQFMLKGNKSSYAFAVVDVEGDRLKFEWGPEWHEFGGPRDMLKPVDQKALMKKESVELRKKIPPKSKWLKPGAVAAVSAPHKLEKIAGGAWDFGDGPSKKPEPQVKAGERVKVLKAVIKYDKLWYQVARGNDRGWLPAESLAP